MRASQVSCADSRSPDEHREVHAASKAAPTASAISGSKGCNGGAGTVSSIAALRPTQLNFVYCGRFNASAVLPATPFDQEYSGPQQGSGQAAAANGRLS